MYSMTGFARTEIINNQISIYVHLKSINGKSCDVNLRMPHAFSSLETDIIRYIKNRFKRGTLTCSLWINGNSLNKSYEFSQENAAAYYNELNNARKFLCIEKEISMKDLLLLPGVIHTIDSPDYNPVYDNLIKDAVKNAADLLEKELMREGGEIQKAILLHIHNIDTIFQIIKKQVIVVVENKKIKLNDIACEATKKAETPSNQFSEMLSLELFRILEKNDISEEIQRFESHLQRLKELIISQVHEKGKHAEFIMQELFRESSTINAKCVDSEVSQNIIILKIELEKIREQLFNSV